jgi:hypothetical protein
MKYSVTWGKKSVRVNYFDDIDNKDIESAHLKLYADERFYDCHHLILDITNCNMDKVSVSELNNVIANDLGASYTNRSLKVAMIANEKNSIKKASDYISQFSVYKSPWDFEIFNSIDDANAWLDA